MSYDLAIATCLYHGQYIHVDSDSYRLGLFRELVRSLARTQWGGIKPVWCLWDDNSPTKWFPSLPGKNLLTGEDIPGDIDIPMVQHVNLDGPTKSASANVIDCLNFAQTLAPMVVVIDSDALVSTRWVLRAIELVEKYPNAPCWGLYNTKFHPEIDYNGFCSDDDAVVFKHTNTIFGTMYRSSDRGQRDKSEWCENFIHQYPEPRVIPVLRRSAIQHTGSNGLNNVAGVIEDYDPSFQID